MSSSIPRVNDETSNPLTLIPFTNPFSSFNPLADHNRVNARARGYAAIMPMLLILDERKPHSRSTSPYSESP